ncbi:ATP-binding protein [Streptomyces cynarae]|uniref:ATP-binding protein n=1 Tax=Streptomyces cynarae TaxID=2981134 RepID=A0ABY6DWQ9_9ACTN|nr:ATP-binding protein [Streptomyces cynarae]UXY17481.1 ATP-binding protein [Streptomyces cynarae]
MFASRVHAGQNAAQEAAEKQSKEPCMVIPLRKQAAQAQGTGEQATLHYIAAWAGGAARAVDARQALRAFLAHAPHSGHPPVPEHVVLDAELAVSELLTNAIRHAPGPCGLILQLSGEELAITVWDTSTEQPVLRRPDRHRAGGYGLHLVRAASNSLAVTPRGQGKQITARLRLAANHSTSAITRTVLSPLPLAQNTADTTEPQAHPARDGHAASPHGQPAG